MCRETGVNTSHGRAIRLLTGNGLSDQRRTPLDPYFRDLHHHLMVGRRTAAHMAENGHAWQVSPTLALLSSGHLCRESSERPFIVTISRRDGVETRYDREILLRRPGHRRRPAAKKRQRGLGRGIGLGRTSCARLIVHSNALSQVGESRQIRRSAQFRS